MPHEPGVGTEVQEYERTLAQARVVQLLAQEPHENAFVKREASQPEVSTLSQLA